MQRRARIKAVANLSASRRPAVRSKSEIHNENEKVNNEIENTEITTSDKCHLDIQPAVTDDFKSNLDTSEKSENEDPVTENNDDEGKVAIPSEPKISLEEEVTMFKTPLQCPPRVECEASSSSHSNLGSKMRRFKVAPRLNAARGLKSSHEAECEPEKSEDSKPNYARTATCISDQELPTELHSPIAVRPDTPRIMPESPSFTVNHNATHSGAPPSPFPYMSHSHSRIRTESLCSIKSNRDVTVANLQPRKNIRTEDQKIIDIKRESRERLSNKDLDKSQLRMFDMIYFNPQNNPMKPKTSPIKTERPKKVDLTVDIPKESIKKEAAAAMPVPQLRLNANGEMVLDETSLVVENEQQKQNRILLASTNVVYDDDLSGNYGYYKRQQRTKEWPHEETVKFYRCLNTVGTDFSLMLNLFPNRSRRDLKLKFKKEEKTNPLLIDKALLKHNTFDLEELQRELDEEEAERKKIAEAKSNSEVKALVKRKILKKQEAKLRAQENAKTKIEKILSDGQLAMSIVDNKEQQDVKENLEIVQQKKRPYKKRTVAHSNMMDLFHVNPIPVGLIESGIPDLTNGGPVAKKPRQSKKAAAKIESKSQQAIVINEEPAQDLEVPQPIDESNRRMKVETITSMESHVELFSPKSIQPIIKTEYERLNNNVLIYSSTDLDLEIASSSPLESMEADAEPLVAFDSHDSVINNQADVIVGESLENALIVLPAEVYDEIEEEPIVFDKECNNEKKNCLEPSNDEPNLNSKPDEISEPKPQEVSNSLPSEKKMKSKSRKRKFKPMLVTRLKLDSNGDMVPDDSTQATLPLDSLLETCQEEIQESCQDAELQPSNESPVNIEFPVIEYENVANVVQEEEELTNKFNGEDFLNSLDLEKLVLVEAHRDGKDVYEIHEIDPVTEEISEKPMDLPPGYVDLIISVMTQQEDE